jgi:hypothetical protein
MSIVEVGTADGPTAYRLATIALRQEGAGRL